MWPMADLHRLPEPALPEGWAPSTKFESEWCRPVKWDRPICENEPEFKAILYVHALVDIGVFEAVLDGVVVARRPTLREAIRAVEAAYCNCRVRGV